MAADGPSPAPAAPWQEAQLVANSALPRFRSASRSCGSRASVTTGTGAAGGASARVSENPLAPDAFDAAITYCTICGICSAWIGAAYTLVILTTTSSHLAAESGGNCEVTVPGQTVVHQGVTVIGPLNLPSMGAMHSSEMYSRNLFNFASLMLKDGALSLDWEDELIAKTCLTHAGEIKHEPTRKLVDGT